MSSKYGGVFADSDESEESGEDFSASEDEWKPGKDDQSEEESEDEVNTQSNSDDEESEDNSDIEAKP